MTHQYWFLDDWSVGMIPCVYTNRCQERDKPNGHRKDANVCATVLKYLVPFLTHVFHYVIRVKMVVNVKYSERSFILMYLTSQRFCYVVSLNFKAFVSVIRCLSPDRDFTENVKSQRSDFILIEGTPFCDSVLCCVNVNVYDDNSLWTLIRIKGLAPLHCVFLMI